MQVTSIGSVVVHGVSNSFYVIYQSDVVEIGAEIHISINIISILHRN